MGLFDNLFLDKDTPMTINTGEEKPVISSSPQGIPQGGSAQGKGGQKDDSAGDPKKENLSMPKNILETQEIALPVPESSFVVIPSEPPTTMEMAGVTATGDSAEVGSDMTFDIGGDLNFDIGGDVLAPAAVDAVEIAPPSGAGVSLEDLHTEAISAGFSVESIEPHDPIVAAFSPELSQMTVAEIEQKSDTKTEDALFSLLNSPVEFTPSLDATEPGMSDMPEVSVIPPVQETSSLFYLTEDDVVSSVIPVTADAIGPQITLPSPVVSEIRELAPVTVVPEVSQPIAEAPLHEIHGVTFLDTPTQAAYEKTLSQIGSLGAVSSPKKIQEILKQSINELHKLEVADAFAKAEIMKEMLEYDTRIEQIEQETQLRIDALRKEREDLEKNLKKIGQESRGIRTLLSSFQKELSLAA